MKTQWILNIFVFVQIHLENSLFFVTRLMLFELAPLFLSYVCARFNIFFLALSFAPFIYRKVRAISSNQTQFALS